MARFHAVKIDSIFLTDNGLEAGTPCKLKISELENLKFSRKSQPVVLAFDGTPYKNGFSTGVKGRQFSISVETLTESIFNQLNAVLEAKDVARQLVRVVASDGATGAFDLDCLFVDLKISGDFFGSLVRGVELSFVAQQNHV